jgi:hypothetical protein
VAAALFAERRYDGTRVTEIAGAPGDGAMPGSAWGRLALQGLRRAPQKPHNSATRRPVPTGIPRTKRHTPVHLLCVLKGTENSRSAASMRVNWAVGGFSR